MQITKCPECSCNMIIGFTDDSKIRVAGKNGQIESTLTIKNSPYYYCMKCRKYFVRQEDARPVANMIEKVYRRINDI